MLETNAIVPLDSVEINSAVPVDFVEINTAVSVDCVELEVHQHVCKCMGCAVVTVKAYGCLSICL
jgi:hypothetical protein